MSVWSFYDRVTGLFLDRNYSGRLLGLNTPEGSIAIAGQFDFLSQRIDLSTGKVVDYQPPSPSADHEWNSERKRWVLKRDVADILARRRSAQKSIESLEAKQARRVRELLAASDPQMKLIDDEIAKLREDLNHG